MAVNSAFLQAGAAAQATAFPFIQIHTAQPSTAGSNESTASRVNAGWVTSNGVLTATNKSFTGGAASGPATYVGLWSAATAGTFGGWYQIPNTPPNDVAFNAAGQYTLNSLVITPSAP
jgi:hypothetical protein